MRRIFIASLAAVAVGALSGCGDPAPSTKLAPEQQLPDTSKMSPEEVQKLHGGGDGTPADRKAAGK